MSARTSSKKNRITQTLREEILSRRYPAGGIFPTQEKLMRRFGVARATIQQVIAQLVQHGLIKPRRGSGTRVATHPPHLTDYALVLPTSPATTGGELWSRLYATLVNQAAALSQCGDQRLIPFYGMDNGVIASEYPRLLQLVQSQRLAGIIFATPPFRLEGTPILDQPGIPRVALMTDVCPQFPHVLAVALGGSSKGPVTLYWRKALDYLATRGRKRVAVLAQALTMSGFDRFMQGVQPLLSARGMTLHPSASMPFGPLDGARVYVQALMQPRTERRPDAMIISDDNLVEPTIAGLIAAGVRVGVDLDIVAHCNFPWTGSSIVPVKRLGFDTRSVLQRCMKLIDRQRAGDTVPAVTTIAAQFENEVEQQPTSTGPMARLVTTGDRK